MRLRAPTGDTKRAISMLVSDGRYQMVLEYLRAEWARSYATLVSPPDRVEFHAGVTATLDQVFINLTNGRSVHHGQATEGATEDR